MPYPDATVAVRRSRWIPWTFVGGFGLVIAVNAVLVLFALTSWSGLETEQAYQKGLAYNATLDAAAAQAARGWHGALDFSPAAGPEGRLSLVLSDKAGAPIDGLSVIAHLVRPTVEGFDRSIALGAEGGGRYSAPLVLPLAGQWRIDIEALGKGAPYRMTERIMVR